MAAATDHSSHFDDHGQARMVDITGKPISVRQATATASISMRPETANMIRQGTAAKGDVLGVARLAAISATKLTPQLIPLCHPIALEAVEVGFAFSDLTTLQCQVTTRTSGKTGVEIEALAGATVACLCVYDLCKSVDRGMQIGAVRLLHKQGGASGDYQADVVSPSEDG